MTRLQVRTTDLQPGEYPLEAEPFWDHQGRRIGFWNFQENRINWFRIPRGTDSEYYIPNHEWNGTQLHWQLPDGSWGPWVDLRGIGVTDIESSDNGDGTFTITFSVGDETYDIVTPDFTGPVGPPGSAPLVDFELNSDGELVVSISYDDDANPATAILNENNELVIEYTGFNGSRIISNVGKIVPSYVGNWSSSVTYHSLDAVFYQDSSYYVKSGLNPPTGTLPTNTVYWAPLALKGENGGNKLNGLVNQTASSYNLSYSDIGKLIACNNANANTVTVVNQVTANWPDELVIINIAQIGDGQTTILADSGVTIVSLYNLTNLAGKGAQAALTRISENLWLLSGALG